LGHVGVVQRLLYSSGIGAMLLHCLERGAQCRQCFFLVGGPSGGSAVLSASCRHLEFLSGWSGFFWFSCVLDATS
jgi:hypothetical protein